MTGLLRTLRWLLAPPCDRHVTLQVLARTAVFGLAIGWWLGPAMVGWVSGPHAACPVVQVAAVAVAWAVSVVAGLFATMASLSLAEAILDD